MNSYYKIVVLKLSLTIYLVHLSNTHGYFSLPVIKTHFSFYIVLWYLSCIYFIIKDSVKVQHSDFHFDLFQVNLNNSF